MTMTPPATSPSPLSSATPRRMSGPIWTVATSPSVTGTPHEAVRKGTARKSSSDFAFAVEFGDSSPHVGAELDRRDVALRHRLAARGGADRHGSEVIERLQ